VLAVLVAMCVLLSGVAPSVSRALAAAGAPGLHDLCVADADGRPAPLPPGHHGDPGEAACALCAPHGGTYAAPPAAVPATAATAVARAVAHRLPAGVPARDAWIAAAPRGPPAAARPA
jgi:hypothetical protein